MWSLNQRFRVNESASHAGFVWSNLTGSNSEPGIGVDWIAIAALSVGARITLTVFGNVFALSKHPANNDPLNVSDLEVNDMITDGYSDDPTIYWPMAMYLGGNKELPGSWNPINPIEDLVII